MLVTSNLPRTAWSADFEITCPITVITNWLLVETADFHMW